MLFFWEREQSLPLCVLLCTKPRAVTGQFYEEFITVIIETLEWDYFSITDLLRVDDGYGIPLLKHTNAETHNFTHVFWKDHKLPEAHISPEKTLIPD